MRTKISQKFNALILITALSALETTGQAQGTAFTYQGQLYDGTNLANGNYDLRFHIYNALTGGSIVAGPLTNAPVAVSNGLFVVTLDFGAGVFTGSDEWLQIGVRSNGVAVAYTALSPRQELTPSPYAIFAEGVNAGGLSGTIPAGDLSGTYGGVLMLNNPGNSYAGNGTGLVNVNALTLDGLGPNNFWQITGNIGTTPGVNFVGTSDNQPFYLDSFGERGLELQYTSRSTFPIFSSSAGINVIGGYWGNIISNNVIGGTIAGGGDTFHFGITTFGQSPNVVNGDFGSVGGGYNNTAGNEGTVPGGNNNTATGTASFAAGAYASATNNYSFVWSDGTAISSSANNSFDIHASGGVHINGADLYLEPNDNTTYGLGYRSSYAGITIDGPVLYSYLGGALAAVSPDTIALTWDYSGDIWVSNNLSTATLTIRGGADLAEPFNISVNNKSVPGAVVVIDDQNPGQLKISERPYDTHVAGVISGAKGVNPGIQMHQQGLLEGGKNVALTGRVYVQADASNGEIRPGDLLTTSSTPGYAMRVSDHARAAGAILGKAMTGLNQGQGMVLVLVTLQ